MSIEWGQPDEFGCYEGLVDGNLVAQIQRGMDEVGRPWFTAFAWVCDEDKAGGNPWRYDSSLSGCYDWNELALIVEKTYVKLKALMEAA